MKIWNGPSPTSNLEKALFVAPQIRGVVSIMAHLGHLQAMGGDGSGNCSSPYGMPRCRDYGSWWCGIDGFGLQCLKTCS